MKQSELGLKQRIKALPVELRIMMGKVLKDEYFWIGESFKNTEARDIVGDIVAHVQKYEGRNAQGKRIVEVSIAQMPNFRGEIRSLLDWTRGSAERTQVLMDKLDAVKLN